MEVPNGWFNAGEFVHIVQVFLAVILAHLLRNMIASNLIDFASVHVVERVLSGWVIKDEGVRVEFGNEGD